MKDWVSCPLGELMAPKNDKAKQVKSTEYSPVGSYPIVDQSSAFICGFHDDEKKLISTNLPLTIFGDHTRHTKFISFPFIAGADGTQLLKPKEALDDKFFFYLVSWAAGKIGNYGYDRHFKHLKEFHCDYPESKPEQTKIAEILSTVDRAIEQTEALIAKQQRIKTGLKTKTDELALKLQLKRLGGDEFKAESLELIRQVEAQLAELDSKNKAEKKNITALNKDKAALNARLAKTDAILVAIGGQLTEAEARELILKKIYDLVTNGLNRYLNTEKRRLIAMVENLWDKYAVSSRELESRRAETLKTIEGFLQSLGYFGGTIKGERGEI